jgi:hypothetical protein
METKTLHEQLVDIQQTLKAPKGQYNSFSKFNYRSCEDILEAVKPLLKGLSLTISDEVVNIGNSNYVKATAYISNGETDVHTTAFAREAIDRKGMDDAQITGSTSSYARKYALNGLFAIDDTKDADTQDNTKISKIAPQSPVEPDTDPEWIKTPSKRCNTHNKPLLQGISKDKVDKDGNPKKYWYHPTENGELCFGI